MMIKEEEVGTLYFANGKDTFVRYFAPDHLESVYVLDEAGEYQYVSNDGEISYSVDRDGGPAIVAGKREWYCKNGRLHRLDGPAFSDGEGYKEYWFYGLRFSFEEFTQYNQFFCRADAYIRTSKVNISEVELYEGSTFVCDSFRSMQAFYEAVGRDALEISTGPRDARVTKWVNIGSAIHDSGLGAGLLVAGALGAIGFAASAMMGKRLQKVDAIQAAQVNA